MWGLRRMDEVGLVADAISYNTVISACAKRRGQLQKMVERKSFSDKNRVTWVQNRAFVRAAVALVDFSEGLQSPVLGDALDPLHVLELHLEAQPLLFMGHHIGPGPRRSDPLDVLLLEFELREEVLFAFLFLAPRRVQDHS